MVVQVVVLGFEGCPNVRPARERLLEVGRDLGVDLEVRERMIANGEEAEHLGFLGSPSLRIAGEDLEGRTGPVVGLSCRVYEDGSGVPPRWLIEAALLRAARPRGVLFLCVANSARSQMAEGIARALAPEGVEVFSAGSRPGGLNPLAVQAMAEVGVDISHHRSKGLEEVPADRVEAVITLCAEEVCPAWLGRAHRVHWGLPDPATAGGDEAARIRAFRGVRDELIRRLQRLFGRTWVRP